MDEDRGLPFALEVSDIGHVVRVKVKLVGTGFSQKCSLCPPAPRMTLLAALARELMSDTCYYDVKEAFVSQSWGSLFQSVCIWLRSLSRCKVWPSLAGLSTAV